MDNFLILYDPGLICDPGDHFTGAFFVDLGYGADPTTTLESAARLRVHHPTLPVLGVEIDPERVAAAQPFTGPLTHFRRGGFNLPLHSGETVRLIRAFNVLRQYDETEVTAAHTRLCHYLLPGGLLIEGTSDPFGRVWVANLIRQTIEGQPRLEAVIFSTNFRPGFEPAQFQPVLPKNFIHRMTPAEPIFAFFEAWKTAYRQALPFRQWGVRRLFATAAHGLAQAGWRIDPRPKWLKRGYLLWYP